MRDIWRHLSLSLNTLTLRYTTQPSHWTMPAGVEKIIRCQNVPPLLCSCRCALRWSLQGVGKSRCNTASYEARLKVTIRDCWFAFIFYIVICTSRELMCLFFV